MKKKVVLFLPMLIALLDVVIEFAIPTNEVINTNGVHYFGYLMLIIAGIYLILGIRACISNTYWCHYYGKIKFHSVAIAFLGLIEILTDKLVVLPTVYFPSVNNILACASFYRDFNGVE